MRRTLSLLALLAGLMAASPRAQALPGRGADAGEVISRVGSRVVEWYAHAQSIVSLEDVWITSLDFNMTPIERPRRLGYELRIAWEPDQASPDSLPEPSVLRQILTINGRPPREDREPGCMDPKPVTPEALEMFLPKERGDYQFTHAGTARIDGRDALAIDYRAIVKGEPDIKWTDQCVSVSLPGRSYGRVWVDASTYDVLRLDEHLAGLFDFKVPMEQQRRGASSSMTIERSDSSIRYRRVEFANPNESLMLPFQIDTTTVVRGGVIRRTHIQQRLSGYRRFVSDVRVLQ